MYYRQCMDNEIQKMTKRLLAAGLTEKDLANRAGCSQPTINRIKKGDVNPSYSLGKTLQALHDEYFQATKH